MPTISGRWVPDSHTDAVIASRIAAHVVAKEEEADEKPAPKKATRTRARRKVETAMVDHDTNGDA